MLFTETNHCFRTGMIHYLGVHLVGKVDKVNDTRHDTWLVNNWDHIFSNYYPLKWFVFYKNSKMLCFSWLAGVIICALPGVPQGSVWDLYKFWNRFRALVLSKKQYPMVHRQNSKNPIKNSIKKLKGNMGNSRCTWQHDKKKNRPANCLKPRKTSFQITRIDTDTNSCFSHLLDACSFNVPCTALTIKGYKCER